MKGGRKALLHADQQPACLLLHGFTGGPFEVEPLAQALQEAGYKTVVPTLPGHGGDLSNLKEVSYQDWLQAVDEYAESMQQAYGSFHLVGFSMGGLLAAYAANRYSVSKLVLLNAALIYVSPLRFMDALGEMVRNGDWSHFKKTKETPLIATVQFVRLARTLRSEFRRISVPTLIVQGRKDHIVHPRSAQILYRLIPAPRELKYFSESRHLICLDCEADRLAETVQRFLLKGDDDC